MAITWVLLSGLLIGYCYVTSAVDPDVWTKGLPSACLNSKDTRFHKDSPSPESKDFKACLSWQNAGCCTANISHEIHHYNAVNLYNYHWDKCGKLSDTCEQFLKHEECFYQCEPMLWYFRKSDKNGYIKDVPICQSYCEDWFEACKDDKTCVEDWLGHFYYDANNMNHCPANSSCVTFTQMYGNAQGMCDKMWGEAFYFAPKGTKCMVMAFDPKTTDNTKGTPIYPSPSSCPATTTNNLLSASVVSLSAMLIFNTRWQ